MSSPTSTRCTRETPTVSDVVVRVAREDEYDAVGALTVAGYDADDYLTFPDGTYDHDYARFLAETAQRGRDSVLLVAVDGDQLLGTVTWCPAGSPAREVSTSDTQGEFRTLSVAQEVRGRGVGRALVSECIERARASGMNEVMLSTLPEMAPAHRLYESFGFKRRPDLDWHPGPGLILWVFSLGL